MDGALWEPTRSSQNFTFDLSATCLMSGSGKKKRPSGGLNNVYDCAERGEVFVMLSRAFRRISGTQPG